MAYYRDPTTGNLVGYGTKVEDTLPVGTIVEFDGATIPVGWEGVQNKAVLYDNANGSNTTITLADSIANYDYIEVSYKAGSISETKKIRTNKEPSVSISLSMIFPIYEQGQTLGVTYFRNTRISITNSSCNFLGISYDFYVNRNGAIAGINPTNSGYEIKITSVIGYKED